MMRRTDLGMAFVTVSAVLALTSRASAQPHHFEDSLRGGTTGSASGGSFGPDGWTVTAVEDRIWFALPRLVSGYVEFTMTNLTLDRLPLADHEMFAMYEAGFITEPIEYSPFFRQNHYKILMRIYGTAEPARQGQIKMMWGMCPSGDPGHSECGCASFFEEPFDDPGPWSGASARIRIEWGGGSARLLRDGVEVVGVDWTDTGLTFGPQDLHMMIGSPRNDGSLSAMPVGVTFSDVVVDGMIGALATCPGVVPPPDAGPPVDGGGGCDASEAATADVTAASWETGVFPDATDLNVEGGDTGPSAIAYLRFPAIPGPVTRATLRLRTSDSGSAAGGSGEICRVEAGAWDESTLTWSMRPAVTATCSGGARRVGPSEEVSWDVTSLITPGENTLAIVSTDPDGAHYLSREAGGCELGPRLEVELAPRVDAGLPPGSDASTPGMDAGGVTGRDAGPTGRPGTGDVDDGCGCRTQARTESPPALLAVALLGLAVARRRNRRAR